MHPLALFGLLAAAVSQAGWITSNAKITEPIREWVFVRACESVASKSRCQKLWLWFHKWFSCARCSGMWYAMVAAGVLRPDFLPGGVLTSALAYALGLALVARLIHSAGETAHETANKLSRENSAEEEA